MSARIKIRIYYYSIPKRGLRMRSRASNPAESMRELTQLSWRYQPNQWNRNEPGYCMDRNGQEKGHHNMGGDEQQNGEVTEHEEMQ